MASDAAPSIGHVTRDTSSQIIARHYATGEPIAVTTTDGRIIAVEPALDDPALPWIAPAFFDLQINGCLGIGFSSRDLTPHGIRTVADECRRHGIAAFCPTVITNSFEVICHAFNTLTNAIAGDADLAQRMPCFHLEGPYLSNEDGPRGAHPKEHIRDPDWDEFRRWQDAAGGRIRMVTLAPERAGALRFIEQLSAAGVVVAIGHTAATGQQIRDAVKAGAKISTHLGNGCHAMLPRHDNYIWEQLACDDLWASVIADGHHLPAAVLKSIIRMKTPVRLLLTCDAGSLAGLPPGRYREWGQELEILSGGKIVVPGTPYLAGSGCFTDACVTHVIRTAGVSLTDAMEMASVRPRELLGLPVPTIEVGQPAELVVINLINDGALTFCILSN
jgi:N-acetylglucosamine-6-phosphate deacetylase